MKKSRLTTLVLVFALSGIVPVKLTAEPLYSPAWGFYLDFPEDYQLLGGDGKNRFSFTSPTGAALDLVVYPAGTYASVEALADDTRHRIGNRGEQSTFDYQGKRAVLMELNFPRPGGGRSDPSLIGWGLCLELEKKLEDRGRPFLLALAYSPIGKEDLSILHLSTLDSIAPSVAERLVPGPLTAFSYPRGKLVPIDLPNSGQRALVAEHDAEAAQALVDREFEVLRRYAEGPHWQEAWIRYYRAIYRDSFERLADVAFVLERGWYTSFPGNREDENRSLAGKALAWVQNFIYERNFFGSDFVNPVSAAVEGRGDCDSRALLWAIILDRANISSAIMVSRDYGHAMGLVDLGGTGARFETGGKRWLVAETTAPVALGLIGEKVSDSNRWLGVLFSGRPAGYSVQNLSL